ncbi:NAD-dependent epimerase/dehydratase family protein [Nitratireductor sp. ZSWI3]|uniref:NAD-dependent epimerase/dehydratase family protein n=1 Tax=Nitratireductor sp. ZSWI3 TaxID=2966359 RepID=UPI002150641F|nr:NAD-dependent epimerase/dehydratase family protein [Nitratireductor sp. ZSWI3]MCR4267842.1 NAD-dependent epimerase/dehydratase family protein [Nitratireductor sp. ZSWI3]
MRLLLTGAAGFIGYHTAQRFAARGDSVLGIDNLNDYYSVALKHARLSRLARLKTFDFARASVFDKEGFAHAAAGFAPDVILHLAAQAGVRYSMENPLAYVEANVAGQVVVFEHAAALGVPIVYASSSSVYGANSRIPFGESDRVDAPASIYAATKRAGELIAGVYAATHEVRCCGLRFFTVYGPFGRPDMAPWLFTDAIMNGRPVSVFDGGTMERDFTHVSDIVDGIVAAVDRICDRRAEIAPVYNLGNNRPARVLDLVTAIERAAGRDAIIRMTAGPRGEARRTCADIGLAARHLNFAPRTSLDEGIADFVAWFEAFHAVGPAALRLHA